MDRFAKDFYMVMGLTFCAVGLITLIVTWFNIPFFFVIGVIFFLLGLEVIKVPTIHDFRIYVQGIKSEAAPKKRHVKKISVIENPAADYEKETE